MQSPVISALTDVIRSTNVFTFVHRLSAAGWKKKKEKEKPSELYIFMDGWWTERLTYGFMNRQFSTGFFYFLFGEGRKKVEENGSKRKHHTAR